MREIQQEVGNELTQIRIDVWIDESTFPSVLKHGNVTSVFEKGYRGSKENYRSVSMLPVISKIFEKSLYNEIPSFMDQFLSKHQSGFGYPALPLVMLEKWKKAVDTKNIFGALLTDLSKAFDCLPHDLIIAKWLWI